MGRPFSWRWTFVAMAVFVVVELLIGGLVGGALLGFRSYSLTFTLQGLLHVAAFAVGGFVVGVVTPGRRLLEPAVAAFLSVALMFALTVFTPYPWFGFRVGRVVVGGGLAFGLALAGAHLGERITGNLR